MADYFFDENMSQRVANALADVGYPVKAVGDQGAPSLGSTDSEVVAWCVAHRRVMVTSDRGRRDRAIVIALAAHRAHVLFVWNGITPRQQLELLVRHIEKIDVDVARAVASGRLYRKRLLRPWRFVEAHGK